MAGHEFFHGVIRAVWGKGGLYDDMSVVISAVSQGPSGSFGNAKENFKRQVKSGLQERLDSNKKHQPNVPKPLRLDFNADRLKATAEGNKDKDKAKKATLLARQQVWESHDKLKHHLKPLKKIGTLSVASHAADTKHHERHDEHVDHTDHTAANNIHTTDVKSTLDQFTFDVLEPKKYDSTVPHEEVMTLSAEEAYILGLTYDEVFELGVDKVHIVLYQKAP